MNTVQLLSKLQQEDLLKFGLIPEMIGRLPVVVAVHPLDKDTLLKILVEPKNALVKQYKKLFELDGAKLEFEAGALETIAEMAVEDPSSGGNPIRFTTEEYREIFLNAVRGKL